MTRKILLMLVLGFFMLAGVGCCPMKKLNISVQLDKSFQDRFGTGRQILVDVVGIKDAELDRWTNYSMTKYWQQGDSLRDTPLRKTLTFNSNSLDPQVVSAKDPLWAKWMEGASDKHPPQIFVLVQVPGSWDASKDDKAGAQDVRRQVIIPSACRNKTDTVHLVIHSDHVSME